VRYETDPPNPGGLLGAQSERPSHDCADRNCAELPAPHCFPRELDSTTLIKILQVRRLLASPLWVDAVEKVFSG